MIFADLFQFQQFYLIFNLVKIERSG